MAPAVCRHPELFALLDADPDAARDWQAYNMGGDIDWVTRRRPSFGTHAKPTLFALRLGSQPASAIAATASAWDALDSRNFDRLLAALRWLLDNPASDC